MPVIAPLSQRLTLANWFAHKMGFCSNSEMLRLVVRHPHKDIDDLRDFLLNHISSAKKSGMMHPDELEKMHGDINSGLRHINWLRNPHLNLKYFQYLSVLASEYTVGRIIDSPDDLAKEVNLMRADFRGNTYMPEVDANYLNKLAFWMATGSGKTIIMHLHMLQMLRYKERGGYFQSAPHGIVNPGNMVLLTPNEMMTTQHLEELELSGISARSFSAPDNQEDVVVLDMHKLSATPGKNGNTLPPEHFDSPNLVFVDEGHKGSSGKAGGYFDLRDMLLADGGFVMEYSATFGQAVAAAGSEHRAQEYGGAVLFDYSYGQFYKDGYGKDFFVLNMDSEAEQKEDMLMFCNLLSFFQQQIAWNECSPAREEFQIQKPLLLMLGANVTGNKDKSDEACTDVMKIARFLRRVASDRDEKNKRWTANAAAKIINGKSGLHNRARGNLFEGKFGLLKTLYCRNGEKLCCDMRNLLFHNRKRAALWFRLLPSSMKSGGQGAEIMLQSAGADRPFGVIYVGESRKLCDIAETDGFPSKGDAFQSPLFSTIDENSSPVNILIGSKKFMEGWNCWRVSSIGLLRVGQSEGPLIVQLFGRGVRLQGKNWSLKRSDYIPASEAPQESDKESIRLLETLNIFSVRANFMAKFRSYLDAEGMLWEDAVTLPIFTSSFRSNELHYMEYSALSQDNSVVIFKDSDVIVDATLVNGISVDIDLTTKYAVVDSGNEVPIERPPPKHISFRELGRFVDFADLYCRLQEYRMSSGRRNIYICPESVKNILNDCRVTCDVPNESSGSGLPEEFQVGAFMQQTAFAAVKQYIDKIYGRDRRLWESKHMKIKRLDFDKGCPNLTDYQIRLRVGEGDALIDDVRNTVAKWVSITQSSKENIPEFLSAERNVLPNVYFDKHLFQPLMLDVEQYHISPPGLNDGEMRFVQALQNFLISPQGAKCLSGAVPTLLRNNSNNGVSIRLGNGDNFYPDFMLWILSCDTQRRERLVFIDPKGLGNLRSNDISKIKAGEYLRHISQNDVCLSLNFEMDSFVVSLTPCADVPSPNGNSRSPEDWSADGLLFLDDMENPGSRERVFIQMLSFQK